MDNSPQPNANPVGSGAGGTGFGGDITKTLKDSLKVSPHDASTKNLIPDSIPTELAEQIEFVPSVVKRRLKAEREEDKSRKTMMDLLLPKIMKKLDEI
jgi:hypothetical protein